MFIPTWGNDPIWLAHMFRMGWNSNHQLSKYFEQICKYCHNESTFGYIWHPHVTDQRTSRSESILTMEVSMYLHGLMVMAKNVEDHRLVMLRAWGPGLFFRERKFSFRKKKAKFFASFSCGWHWKEIWREAKQKWCESTAKLSPSCLTKRTFCLMCKLGGNRVVWVNCGVNAKKNIGRDSESKPWMREC